MSPTAPTPERVLYLVSLFPCWSETFIVREIERFVERGVDVRILSLKPPSEKLVQKRAEALMDRVIGPRNALAELPTVLLEALRHPIAVLVVAAQLLFGLWKQPAALGKSAVAVWRGLAALPAIRRFDPQWLHAHWATYPSTVAWALSKLTGIPFSFTAHAHDIFVEDQLIAPKLADAALGVTISRYNVRYLARWGADVMGERLQVVHCGVDFGELAENLDARAADHIVTVGRLDPIKGFDTLMPALGLLKRRGVAFRCTVIGEGPQRRELEAQIAAEDLGDRVALVGAKPQEAVRAALNDATVFVMPSVTTPEGNQDGIPVALMEAMATAGAVVSTAVSGIPELVNHDRTGLVVPPGDAPALADALQRLLADESLRHRLGLAARAAVAADFDARHEADRLLAQIGVRCAPPQGLAHAR
ncbi:MAG: glycosyltransferase [Silanimonas sp.]